MSTSTDPSPLAAHFPTDSNDHLGPFDRFATYATKIFSNAWFFTFCVLVVLIWAPSYFVLDDLDTWQLIINTATTIITFLMVALLQNSQTRADQAIQGKLNAIADALTALMETLPDQSNDQTKHDIDELKSAIGLERREST